MVETLQAQSQQDRSEGKKGLQHTPAFMLAVVKDALSVLALQRSSGISTKTSGPNRDPLTRTFAQGATLTWASTQAAFLVTRLGHWSGKPSR